MSYETPILEAGALSPASMPSPSTLVLPSLGAELSRLGSGLLLAAVYGLALGTRDGGLSLVRHALGAPLGLLVVAGVAAPALFVRLALMDAPLGLGQLLAAVARGVHVAGLVMAGLAPALTLLVVSIESARAAAWMSGLGLWLAGGIGLCSVLSALSDALAVAEPRARARAWLSVGVFALLSAALAARAWYGWLPLLGGGT